MQPTLGGVKKEYGKNMKYEFQNNAPKNFIAWQFHTSDTSLENIEYQMSKQWLYQEYD